MLYGKEYAYGAQQHQGVAYRESKQREQVCPKI